MNIKIFAAGCVAAAGLSVFAVTSLGMEADPAAQNAQSSVVKFTQPVHAVADKQNWEYLIEKISTPLDDPQVAVFINARGSEGWEVVSFYPSPIPSNPLVVVFKRPK